MSQRDLCEAIGSNQSFVWEIEKDSLSMGFDVLGRVTDAPGVRVSELIDF